MISINKFMLLAVFSWTNSVRFQNICKRCTRLHFSDFRSKLNFSQWKWGITVFVCFVACKTEHFFRCNRRQKMLNEIIGKKVMRTKKILKQAKFNTYNFDVNSDKFELQ